MPHRRVDPLVRRPHLNDEATQQSSKTNEMQDQDGVIDEFHVISLVDFHSHSMVPGGLLVTSNTTRLTSRTSLVMRVEIRAMSS